MMPLRPTRAFYVCFGLAAILLFAFNVPPYQVPDEINHFKRADQVSRAEIIGYRVEPSTRGGVVIFAVLALPMSLSQMASVSQDGPMVALAGLVAAIFADSYLRDRPTPSIRLSLRCA